jgi:hypothetical protein
MVIRLVTLTLKVFIFEYRLKFSLLKTAAFFRYSEDTEHLFEELKKAGL